MKNSQAFVGAMLKLLFLKMNTRMILEHNLIFYLDTLLQFSKLPGLEMLRTALMDTIDDFDVSETVIS